MKSKYSKFIITITIALATLVSFGLGRSLPLGQMAPAL
jgi:hypothetical protein